MPSRPVIVLAFLFWGITLGFVLYRDLLPRLGASAPPPIAIDVADEASQQVQTKWSIVREGKTIGTLSSRMVYVDADDSFQFITKYFDVVLYDSMKGKVGMRISIPKLQTVTRISRAGYLREQEMTGEMIVEATQRSDRGVDVVELARGQARIVGRVENGKFLGHCDIDSKFFQVHRDLEPIPVMEGQALNPLQPVNRIANITSGQRWVVHEINPMEESVGMLFKNMNELGFNMPEQSRLPLIATVSDSPESLSWGGQAVQCWVIEYRTDQLRAKTWVRVTDGKVLRQEAFKDEEKLSIIRDE